MLTFLVMVAENNKVRRSEGRLFKMSPIALSNSELSNLSASSKT